MPESVLVQVGQCGNQIGFNFWTNLLQEYRYYCNELTENHLNQFLKPKSKVSLSSKPLTESYSARGILIDMEEGVINAGRRSFYGSLFLKNQILTDVSGSGNNWAVGNLHYGRIYIDSLKELFRIQAEACDNLDSFLFVFSLGGGTGSGLGSAALELLADYYPKTWRMVFSIFPSDLDDVITSPYNAVLSNDKLLQHAHVVIPFENQAMENIFMRLESNKFVKRKMAVNPKNKTACDVPKAFDKLNDLIVTTMLDCTSSSRYSDLRSRILKDLTLDLSPDKYLIYSVPSIAPMFASDDSSVERLFNEVSSDNNVLFDCGSQKKFFCGTTIFARGKMFNSAVVQNNVNRLCKNMLIVKWARQSIQYGVCDFPPVNKSASLVMLSNTSAVTHNFQLMKIRLDKMYKKKAHLHHFTNEDANICDSIDHAVEQLNLLIKRYEDIKTTHVTKIPFVI